MSDKNEKTDNKKVENTKTTLTPEQKKEKVLSYLKNKYGEDFVMGSMEESGWGQSHDSFVLHPLKGTKNDAFTVWGSCKKDGTYDMHDSYYGIIIKPEYEAVISDFVKEYYKEFKLYTDFGAGVFADNLNRNTKISEVYNLDPLFSSETVVFVKKSSADASDVSENLKKIAVKMRAKKLIGKVKVYIVFDNKYETSTLDTYSNVLERGNGKEFFTDDSRKYIRVLSDVEISEVENG
ncbi:MAG TPA: hypothetical protein VF941_03740 [Clostridia bacterium]